MKLKVQTGNITQLTANESPSAITTITADQIEISQAKHLANLLEIYVPGLMLMTHSEGDKIGIRGQIAAENYKLLILVNGVNMTNMVYEGVITEIDMWDMADIEKIEVVRGPGSVTYGTGAIAGVINIITKSKANTSAGYRFDPIYNSMGGNLQFSKKLKNSNLFFHGSFNKTSGFDSPKYYELSKDSALTERIVGNRLSDSYKAQPYLTDGNSRPQIKLQTEYKYKENFKVWVRYTQAGQARHFSTLSPELNSTGDTVGTQNARWASTRSFAISPSYDKEINDKLKINLNASVTSQEYIRNQNKKNEFAPGHPNNISDYAFSQTRYTAKALIDYKPNDITQIVTGFEYDLSHVRAPWFQNQDHLLIREGLYFISDTTNSVYYNDPNSNLNKDKGVEQVGNGFDVGTFSYILETKLDLNDWLKMIVSGRLDKPTISNTMFSPRAALIGKIDDKNTIRLNLQRSLRMMPLRAQYLYYNYGESTAIETRDAESINSYEISYTRLQGLNWLFNLNAYYNDLDAVGYTGSDLQFIGRQQLFGTELEVKYSKKSTDFTFNHSFLQQLDFDFSEELKTGSNRNNITYADYHYVMTKGDYDLNLMSYGNGINNWSNNSSRLAITHKLLNNNLVLHLNTRVFWDYTGSYDEANMYREAYENFDVSNLTAQELEGFKTQKAIFEREMDFLDDNGAFKTDFRFNGSVSYAHTIKGKYKILTTIYSENLLGSQKRYYVSTGSSNVLPNRLKYMEEPTTVGFRVKLTFL